MIRKITHYTFVIFGLVAVISLPLLAHAQALTASVDITRTPYLTMQSLPASFEFSATGVGTVVQNLFSNGNTQLPAGNVVSVRDTRNSGGFTLQAQATNFVSIQNPANLIPASNLRIITSSQINPAPIGDQIDDIYYLTGYTGTPDTATTQNVVTPIAASGTAFGTVSTFDAVENVPHAIRMNAPVDIMVGCLPASAGGRVGTMATGVAFNLQIPAYTPAGDYASTITYTIIDNTPSTCP